MAGSLRLPLQIGMHTRNAALSQVKGAQAVFRYTVQEGDADDNGLSINANALTLGKGGSVKDAANNDAVLSHGALSDEADHQVDGIRPRLTSMEFVRHTLIQRPWRYGTGDRIVVLPKFSEPVVHSALAVPQISLDFDGKTKTAIYEHCRLPFWLEYEVQDEDYDLDGIAVSANSFEVPNGYLRDMAGNDANLAYGKYQADDTHRVGPLPPKLKPEISVSAGPDVAEGENPVFTFTTKKPPVVSAYVYMWVTCEGSAASSFCDQWFSVTIPTSGVLQWKFSTEDDDTAGVNGSMTVTLSGNSLSDYTVNDKSSTATVNVLDNDYQSPENSPATGQPLISGTDQVGETLTAGTSGIADADGMSNVSYLCQWLVGIRKIIVTTGSSYTLTDSEEGNTITVTVTFTDDAGNAESLTGAATAAVKAKPNSPATGQPTISGTVQVGETLTAGTSGIADADGMSKATFSYQWQTQGKDIAGATSDRLTLGEGDVGKEFTVAVAFTDDADHEESLNSPPTAPVAWPPECNDNARKISRVTATARHPDSIAITCPGDYVVRYWQKKDKKDTYQRVRVSRTEPSFTAENLSPRTTYQFRVHYRDPETGKVRKASKMLQYAQRVTQPALHNP